MENEIVCKKCGKKLLTKIDNHTLMVFCPEHGEVMCTSYFSKMETDNTNYVIYLNTKNECSIDNIKLISKILNTNFVQAKQVLLSNEPVELFQANNYLGYEISKAERVLEIARLLTKNKINFYITPEFKYEI